ncbi:unnamed protein product [Malus baccata var. baccata]
MQASDRFNINSQLEHLQAKYVGTGHADMNRYEWAVNIQRDSYASYVGHYPMLAYFALAENESIGRERYNFMQVLSCFAAFMTLRTYIGCFSVLIFTLLVWLCFIGLLLLPCINVPCLLCLCNLYACDIVIVVYFLVCAYRVRIFIRGLSFTDFMAEVIATYY